MELFKYFCVGICKAKLYNSRGVHKLAETLTISTN